MLVLTLLLYLGAVARLTRLVNFDEVTDPLRVWVIRKTGPHSKATYFLACPWCVSLWIAGGSAWFPLVMLDEPLWLWALLAPAVSWVVGMVAQLDRAELDIEVTDEV